MEKKENNKNVLASYSFLWVFTACEEERYDRIYRGKVTVLG